MTTFNLGVLSTDLMLVMNIWKLVWGCETCAVHNLVKFNSVTVYGTNYSISGTESLENKVRHEFSTNFKHSSVL